MVEFAGGQHLWRNKATKVDVWRSELEAQEYLVHSIRFGIQDMPKIPLTKGVVLDEIPKRRRRSDLKSGIWRRDVEMGCTRSQVGRRMEIFGGREDAILGICCVTGRWRGEEGMVCGQLPQEIAELAEGKHKIGDDTVISRGFTEGRPIYVVGRA